MKVKLIVFLISSFISFPVFAIDDDFEYLDNLELNTNYSPYEKSCGLKLVEIDPPFLTFEVVHNKFYPRPNCASYHLGGFHEYTCYNSGLCIAPKTKKMARRWLGGFGITSSGKAYFKMASKNDNYDTWTRYLE